MNKGDDLANSLLDDDAFDPEKLFDEKEYSTLIIDREGFNKKQNNVADLLEALLEPKISREESEAIFSKLKETKAQAQIIATITEAENIQDKKILTAACWECGLDFSEHLLFFTELAGNRDFSLAMEALTVVTENMEEVIPNETLMTALNLIAASKSPNKELIQDLAENIKSRLA